MLKGGGMFSIPRIAVALIMALLLPACGTARVGRDFDVRSAAMKIERGVTTQQQISAWLGAPTGTGASIDTNGEHFDEWSYYFASGRLPDLAGARVKILQIKFDRQGIVRAYNWSASDQ